ncbi:MAG: hypothetical protein Q9164_001945 [Protoblastenia rupestris]
MRLSSSAALALKDLSSSIPLKDRLSSSNIISFPSDQDEPIPTRLNDDKTSRSASFSIPNRDEPTATLSADKSTDFPNNGNIISMTTSSADQSAYVFDKDKLNSMTTPSGDKTTHLADKDRVSPTSNAYEDMSTNFFEKDKGKSSSSIQGDKISSSVTSTSKWDKDGPPTSISYNVPEKDKVKTTSLPNESKTTASNPEADKPNTTLLSTSEDDKTVSITDKDRDKTTGSDSESGKATITPLSQDKGQPSSSIPAEPQIYVSNQTSVLTQSTPVSLTYSLSKSTRSVFSSRLIISTSTDLTTPEDETTKTGGPPIIMYTLTFESSSQAIASSSPLSKPEVASSGTGLLPSKASLFPSKPSLTVIATNQISSMTFPGFATVPASMTEAAPSDQGLFTNATTAATPVWTPSMLGNAYGGGYIVTPSIYVTKLPYLNGPSDDVPPGYGSLSIPEESQIIRNSSVPFANKDKVLIAPYQTKSKSALPIIVLTGALSKTITPSYRSFSVPEVSTLISFNSVPSINNDKNSKALYQTGSNTTLSLILPTSAKGGAVSSIYGSNTTPRASIVISISPVPLLGSYQDSTPLGNQSNFFLPLTVSTSDKDNVTLPITVGQDLPSGVINNRPLSAQASIIAINSTILYSVAQDSTIKAITRVTNVAGATKAIKTPEPEVLTSSDLSGKVETTLLPLASATIFPAMESMNMTKLLPNTLGSSSIVIFGTKRVVSGISTLVPAPTGSPTTGVVSSENTLALEPPGTFVALGETSYMLGNGGSALLTIGLTKQEVEVSTTTSEPDSTRPTTESQSSQSADNPPFLGQLISGGLTFSNTTSGPKDLTTPATSNGEGRPGAPVITASPLLAFSESNSLINLSSQTGKGTDNLSSPIESFLGLLGSSSASIGSKPNISVSIFQPPISPELSVSSAAAAPLSTIQLSSVSALVDFATPITLFPLAVSSPLSPSLTEAAIDMTQSSSAKDQVSILENSYPSGTPISLSGASELPRSSATPPIGNDILASEKPTLPRAAIFTSGVSEISESSAAMVTGGTQILSAKDQVSALAQTFKPSTSLTTANGSTTPSSVTSALGGTQLSLTQDQVLVAGDLSAPIIASALTNVVVSSTFPNGSSLVSEVPNVLVPASALSLIRGSSFVPNIETTAPSNLLGGLPLAGTSAISPTAAGIQENPLNVGVTSELTKASTEMGGESNTASGQPSEAIKAAITGVRGQTSLVTGPEPEQSVTTSRTSQSGPGENAVNGRPDLDGISASSALEATAAVQGNGATTTPSVDIIAPNSPLTLTSDEQGTPASQIANATTTPPAGEIVPTPFTMGLSNQQQTSINLISSANPTFTFGGINSILIDMLPPSEQPTAVSQVGNAVTTPGSGAITISTSIILFASEQQTGAGQISGANPTLTSGGINPGSAATPPSNDQDTAATQVIGVNSTPFALDITSGSLTTLPSGEQNPNASQVGDANVTPAFIGIGSGSFTTSPSTEQTTAKTLGPVTTINVGAGPSSFTTLPSSEQKTTSGQAFNANAAAGTSMISSNLLPPFPSTKQGEASGQSSDANMTSTAGDVTSNLVTTLSSTKQDITVGQAIVTSTNAALSASGGAIGGQTGRSPSQSFPLSSGNLGLSSTGVGSLSPIGNAGNGNLTMLLNPTALPLFQGSATKLPQSFSAVLTGILFCFLLL